MLSVDQNAFLKMVTMFGASLALCLSNIPFNGSIAGVNVGLIDGEFTINAGPEDVEGSLINLEVAETEEVINMVETDAKEVDEETMLNALMFGYDKIKELIAFQEKVVEAYGKEKTEIPLFELDSAIVEEVESLAKERMIKAVSIPGKLERYGAIDDINAEVVTLSESRDYADLKGQARVLKQMKIISHNLEKDEVRRLTIEDKIRPDGRKIDKVRSLNT